MRWCAVASPTSDPFDRPAVERLAATLLAAMALLAVACVALALGADALPSGRAWSTRLLTWGRDAIVLAPLVSLGGVALRALRGQRRLGWFALAALAVTLLGMGVAMSHAA
jgi:hypothetical protein